MKNLNKSTFALSILIALLGLAGCSSGNLDYVKTHGPDKWRDVGFEPVGYEGYQWGKWGLNSYGGACVWWRLNKIPDNGISYAGCIQRWGDELHVYGPNAIDAIKP